MAYSTLTYERDGRVARINFDRPERLNAIAAGTPGDIAGRGRRGQCRRPGPCPRAFRARFGLLFGLRPQGFRRGRKRGDPGADALGSDEGLRPDEGLHREVHEPVAVLQAGDLQGAGLRRRRRVRHRPVLRSRRNGGGRADRLSAGPRLGLPDHGHVGLSPGRGGRQAHAADRRSGDRDRSEGHGPGDRRRPRRPAGCPGRGTGRGPWPACRRTSS